MRGPCFECWFSWAAMVYIVVSISAIAYRVRKFISWLGA